MSPREANVLLTKIALVDRWFKRDADSAVAQAEAWADLLADVSLDDALAAVTEHYRAEGRSIMPADIVAACVQPQRSASWVGNATEQRLAAERLAVES